MSKKGKCNCCKCSKVKRILGGIGIALVFVVSAVFILRDIIIEHSVEQVGAYLTGTPIKIGRFYTSIFGRVEIKDFTVGNPPGYSHPHAIELAEVVVDIDMLSLFTDRIKVNLVKVDGMGVNYSVGFGKSNLGEILDHLDKVTAQSDQDTKENKKPSEEDKEEAKVSKKVEITELSITGNHVSFGKMTIPLGGIVMRDIGKENDASIADVVDELFTAIVKSTAAACQNVGSVLGESAGSAVESVNRLGNDAVKAIKDLF